MLVALPMGDGLETPLASLTGSSRGETLGGGFCRSQTDCGSWTERGAFVTWNVRQSVCYGQSPEGRRPWIYQASIHGRRPWIYQNSLRWAARAQLCW